MVPAGSSQLTVQGLIVIAGDNDPVVLGQQLDDRRLHAVEVLVFVNQYEVVPSDRGRVPPQLG